MDLIGAELVDLYPERFVRVAADEAYRVMPACPLCGTGDCTSHRGEEDDVSARPQQTENKSMAPRPDPFEGTYDVLPTGNIRFHTKVVLDVPAPGGARTKVLVAAQGMVRPAGWLNHQRTYYGLPLR